MARIVQAFPTRQLHDALVSLSNAGIVIGKGFIPTFDADSGASSGLPEGSIVPQDFFGFAEGMRFPSGAA
eukprot:15446599-Alexandrium_andersonii.AAC.1